METSNLPTQVTVKEAIDRYIDSIRLSRSENTSRTYSNALNIFTQVLDVRNLPINKTDITDLPEDSISWFAAHLKIYSPSTERLYLTAADGLFQFISAEKLSVPNLSRIRLLIRQRSRRTGQRLPQFPNDKIEEIIKYAINLAELPFENDADRLRNLRDRAFLITLADTGLRVHEACRLRRGDIDWNEGRAIIIGKGNKQAVVRFSQRSMKALKDYLSARAKLDGNTGKPLSTLALFARHDKGSGKKVKPITTKTGRKIVENRVSESIGSDAVGSITPHSFRHYFVTTVLRASGNLKLAQELARHQNIAVTQRYAHLSNDELDQGYWEVFEK